MKIVFALLLFLGIVIGFFLLTRFYFQMRVRAERNRNKQLVIDELTTYEIGGIKQWLQIRSSNANNPVLLYLHGGPGMPMLPFSHMFQSDWEQHYTVVQWDQRDAGKTLMENISPAKDITFERYVYDTLEVVEKLRARFDKSKLVLFGHSWGTMIGVAAIQARPSWFDAYVGIGQVTTFQSAERYGYIEVLKEAKRINDLSAIKALSRFSHYPSPPHNSLEAHNVVRHQQVRLRFCHHGTSQVMLKLFALAFMSPDYGWRDLLSLLIQEPRNNAQRMALELIPNFDPRQFGISFECPIYLVGGKFDLFTPTPMARSYFDDITAPKKRFLELENAAHFGPLESPTDISELLMNELLQDIQ